ncbi:hypothetical protein JX265_007163 [Neoarthrinium moseri]|uniref:Uncharacterized protein n=1 Tax=Neoarthrinium moseri TaxID=1658444 RepID=A0A9P9WKU7_9PEZI|nr:uncharacterized protein JN550_010062 [Neoarthrinium moseri]KAI1840413.1 hypothetical protein JX266_013380 [Neoarthrinium moseri]KAI1862725.1 hypothetical protein JN550_010062 [Neoarthrinium moseri]KAI1868340.1 hypothetical protein JX265_007163 [Neoarthrinium moseri]
MKASPLFIILTTAAFAMAKPASFVQPRQDDAEAIVNKVLADARAKSAARIKEETGEGRRLTECGTLCSQCRNGAITTALGEVALCGTTALALEVASAGTTTILEVAGFLACETIVIGNLNESEANCAALGP